MIRLENIHIEFPGFYLKDINLSIEKGEFFALIGPTGAGKTVLLEALAGLTPIKQGRIVIGGTEVTNLPPEKRGIGIVYQDYALFPHLTVIDNINYGLHFHKIDITESQHRLNWLLDQFNLRSLVKRFPTNLSGGELQRVAMARALMVNPSVLLLDEPLSALDPNFRAEIQAELKKLQQETDVTFLMVTHDFNEVLSLANRAAVMNKGIIEQIGDVKEIFGRPNSPFVANFVGMKNLFEATFNGTQAILQNLRVEIGRTVDFPSSYVAIRPEEIVISPDKISSSMRNSYQGKITRINNHNFYYEVIVDVNDVLFTGLITKGSIVELKLEEGKPVYVSFKASAVHVF